MDPASREPSLEAGSTKRVSAGLAATALAYVEARGTLLSLEAQESIEQVLRGLKYAALGITALSTFWLLGFGALAAVFIEQWEWPLTKALGVLAGANLLLALLFFLIVWRVFRGKHWFTETLNEFKKDRTWLASQTGKL